MPESTAAAAERQTAVDAFFRVFPERYLGGPPCTVQIRLPDIGRVYEVRCGTRVARAGIGTSERPDVVLTTDSQTWLDMADVVSGLEAYCEHRMAIRGDLDLALGFPGRFRRPGGERPLLQVRDIDLDDCTLNVLSAGRGRPVLLVHGLGATKASFYDAAVTLARAGYEVHAPDVPGFGSSSKSLRAPYTADWLSAQLLALMDKLDIDRAHLVGNSMGGRLAIEVGLRAPERVGGLALLCPAVAMVRRPLDRPLRVMRPEIALVPHGFRRSTIDAQLASLFADPALIDPAILDVYSDEFQRIYQSPSARFAYLKTARNLYLDRPYGRGGFYPRLAGLRPPAIFVWGAQDRLIPPAFGRHVAKALPRAEQIVLENTGHLPQVEHPARTSALIQRFLRRCDALSAPPPSLRDAA